jgi:hypothetical protein
LQREASQLTKVNEEGGGAPKQLASSRLTEERLNRLESIGFKWKATHKTRRYQDDQWDEIFERLKFFKEKTGHCLVPKRFSEDPKLGAWVHSQRQSLHRKRKTDRKSNTVSGGDAGLGTDTDDIKVMTTAAHETSFPIVEDRRVRLESIGFVWNVRGSENGKEGCRIGRNSFDDQWDAMYNQLKAYKDKYGDCLVPKRFSENHKLATWVGSQRVKLKKLKKGLAEELIVNAEFRQKEALGDPSTVPVEPAIGRITDYRIRSLDDLGFVWSVRDDWQKHYEELKVSALDLAGSQ